MAGIVELRQHKRYFAVSGIQFGILTREKQSQLEQFIVHLPKTIYSSWNTGSPISENENVLNALVPS